MSASAKNLEVWSHILDALVGKSGAFCVKSINKKGELAFKSSKEDLAKLIKNSAHRDSICASVPHAFQIVNGKVIPDLLYSEFVALKTKSGQEIIDRIFSKGFQERCDVAEYWSLFGIADFYFGNKFSKDKDGKAEFTITA